MGLFGEDKYQYRIRRITCDIDNLSMIRVHWCLLIFKILGFRYETTVRLSQSKNGRHIISWAHHKGLSREFLFVARILAGDDRYRVYRDQKDRMIQILWRKKEPLYNIKNKIIKKCD